MLIQRGLAYLDIAGEEELVGSVLELTPNIRRVPFFMEEKSKKTHTFPRVVEKLRSKVKVREGQQEEAGAPQGPNTVDR